MSNAGGMSTIQRYTDMLAGNTVWNPWEPEGAYDSLATVTVGTAVSTVTFAAIPNTYKHLQIRYIGRTNWSIAQADFLYSLNGDTTNSNYAYHRLGGNGSIAFSQASTSLRAIGINNGSDAPANMFATGIMDILDYSSTTKNKTVRNLVGADRNGSGTVALYSNLYLSTSAVNSISLITENGSWVANSQFTLYGVK
jgi:hypothetical protein